jgi:DNA-binding XRE family transcriptional regulator
LHLTRSDIRDEWKTITTRAARQHIRSKKIEKISTMIFAGEIRAARGLLGWTQVELAEAAGVGIATVRRLEAAGAEIRGSVETVWKIQTALEAAGIEFISAEGGKGPGVRLKAPARPAQKSGRKGS